MEKVVIQLRQTLLLDLQSKLSHGDAGRNINPSAPMMTTVYSTGTEEPDAIRKLYPLIIGDPEKNKK